MVEKQCTVAELFQALSGKWLLPVLYQIQYEDRPVRFGELRKAVGGITPSELTKALRHLESLGLAQREQFNEIPPRVEYRPTQLAISLRPPLETLAAWLIASQSEVTKVLAAKPRRKPTERQG